MKYYYGKHHWKTLEQGEEHCYLMTNSLGGFSSQSIIGSCSRNDQALLMACTHSPNCRYNMIHRLDEQVQTENRIYILSSQDFQNHQKAQQGYQYLSNFTFEHYPQWSYLLPGVEILKTAILEEGKNTIGISYYIDNRSTSSLTLQVKPHMQFVPKGERVPYDQEFLFEALDEGACISVRPKDSESSHAEQKASRNAPVQDLRLYLKTNGSCKKTDTEFTDTLYYRRDIDDGKMTLGRCSANHVIEFQVLPGTTGTLDIVYGMEETLPSFNYIQEKTEQYHKTLLTQAGYTEELPRQLVLSAMQFISHRASTGKKTILAGYPFFEDWGRDTMIALPGCCLATKQYETAKAILETFMAYCHRGLMPNLFPEGSQSPLYNTVDAALLFILTVYEYEKHTGDTDFVERAYPVMEEIIKWYRQGTDFNIHMEEDGLITAGSGYHQVTWMDVQVENILPTPRHGKPVEINAYWYNALRMMEQWQKRGFGPQDQTQDYGTLADTVRESFRVQFWNQEADCLRDLVSGTKADDQIRCNQIWAVSLPFSLLSPQQEKAVVETVFRHLYTPYGLRTLSPEDLEFRPIYRGAQLDRDLAYHQGTVWVFPLGAYYRAYLKVHQYSAEAKHCVKRQLSYLHAALAEGCIGQLPEIYDGANPVESQGCFAQAWSVGEILRVWHYISNGEQL